MTLLAFCRRYAQSIGIISYAFTQWIFLIYYTRIAGLEGAGSFSLAQAIAMPAFAALAFNLRQWWVGGVLPNFTKSSFIAVRITTSFLAVIISLFAIFLSDTAVSLSIFFLVLLLKFHESLSDAVYAALDIVGRSDTSGFLLFTKSVTLLLIATGAFIGSADPRTVLEAVAFASGALVVIELLAIRPLSWKGIQQISVHKVSSPLLRLLLFTSLSSLMVTLQGYLPRYAIAFLGTRAELGYFALVTIPGAIAIMITTGICQSHLLQYRAQVRAGQPLKRAVEGFKSIKPLMVTVSVAAFSMVLAYYCLPASATFRSLRTTDLFYLGIMLLFSIPLIFAQFLSYFITPLGKPGLRFFVNALSFLGSCISAAPLIYLDPIAGAGAVIAVGGLLQSIGFVAILVSSGATTARHLGKF